MKLRFLHFSVSKLTLLLILGLIGLVLGCQRSEDIDEVAKKWSAFETQSIPLRVRSNQFDKENLVVNPSFEEGKYFLKDSDDRSANIKGWAKIGRSVEWVDTSLDLYSKEDVRHGQHAIKVSRRHANETDDPGEGILSEFIRVIPGNYLFNYDVKLQNINPNAGRLGTRLFDAVNVKVQFYDKNKVEIESMLLNPYKKSTMDASFKAYSFSNFWHIDTLGWGKVRGRTYNYPFSEGDLPDGTFYVRIFLGLKGTGTMWVDNIEFKYSKWNFTALERFQPYFDSLCSPTLLLVPMPKQVKELRLVPVFKETQSGIIPPIISVPPDASKQTLMAAQLLKKRIEKVQENMQLESSIGNIELDFTGEIPDNFQGLVLSVGHTFLYNKLKDSIDLDKIKNKSQGYIIKSFNTDQNVVILAGNSTVGDYYAATTLVQLIDIEKNQLQTASIVDFPDFTGRSYLFSSWQTPNEMEEDINSINRMTLLKFNKAYVGYGQTKGRKEWYDPDDLYINGVKNAGRKCMETGVIDLGLMVNPYYHFGYEMNVDSISVEQKRAFVHSDPQSLRKLKNVYKIGLDAGAKTIMLMADDFMPHEGDNRKNYVLYSEEDKSRFVNLQDAHSYVINNLHAWVRNNYGTVRFEYCPPWYLNEFIDRSRGKAEYYFNDLMPGIPADVSIIWTGHTVRSLSYDVSDFARYTNLIGKKPMIWDNTLYARSLDSKYGGYPAYYPGKIKLCNIFEPYDVLVPDDFQNKVDGPHMYVNGSASSEIYKIKYATVADFEWNTSAYDPEFSLWKVLVSQFGGEAAKHLIQFNDAYYSLKEIIELVNDEWNSKQYNKGTEYVSKIEVLLNNLKEEIPDNQKLLNELQEYQDSILEAYSETSDSLQ